jgi:hypothetical protein
MSYSISSYVLISCDVRKPSKKCRNGSPVRIVVRCATAARSCASWTPFEQIIGTFVDRTA